MDLDGSENTDGVVEILVWKCGYRFDKVKAESDGNARMEVDEFGAG